MFICHHHGTAIKSDSPTGIEPMAEKAAGKRDVKELYSITRTLAGARKIPDRPMRAKNGEVLTEQEEQRKRWAESFLTDLYHRTSQNTSAGH